MFPNLVFLSSFLIAMSSLLGVRFRYTERLFSLSIVRSLLAQALIILEYLYISDELTLASAAAVLSSQAVWSLTWAFTANRLHAAATGRIPESLPVLLAEPILGATLCVTAWWSVSAETLGRIIDGAFYFPPYGTAYCYALFVLVSALFAAWRLEGFWRNLPLSHRWEYRVLVVAGFLVSATYVFTLSYQITYLWLVPNHFLVLAALMTLSWLLMLYAVARHRLLNRKLFLSRQVIYASIAPFFFGMYLLGVGLISMAMRRFGWPIPEILFWLAVAMGFIGAGLYLCSGRLRRRVHYFISVHFYLNKHDYREIWRALSMVLKGASSEEVIAQGVVQVLSSSLYADNVMIWLGNESKGYRLAHTAGPKTPTSALPDIPGDHPIVEYLRRNDHLCTEEKRLEEESNLRTVFEEWLSERNLVLLTPVLLGEELLGVIGLGREFTGGRYGPHDFDLLAAIGTQAASSLLTVQMAEEIGALRQREAWSALSTFILHDIKNAAAMLSLVSQNAEEHLHNPEFQLDMLDAVKNALKRMNKVQNHLTTLRSEIVPRWQDLELCSFLGNYVSSISRKLANLHISLDCPSPTPVTTDPMILSTVIENLLINSLEAGGAGTTVSITVSNDHRRAQILLSDDGPGIPPQLLPDKLFQPFRTTKESGSGIGLWQARTLLERIGGIVRVGTEYSPSTFVLTIPFRHSREPEESTRRDAPIHRNE